MFINLIHSLLNRDVITNRDCTTQPGNFVLTCCWESKHLHFVIQKVAHENIDYDILKLR